MDFDQTNLPVYHCFASTLSRETVLSDFPHSRQTRLARGVISPQNGHILCNRTSWVRGRKIANNFPRNSRREARRRRRGGRYDSIRFHLCGEFADCANPTIFNDDRARPMILCRIAHISRILQSAIAEKLIFAVLRTEQFRSAIVFGVGDHDSRDEHFFSLFQVL